MTFTVFVPFALPGETVKVSINMVKKTYATGRLLEIVTMAPNRIDPRCDLYGFLWWMSVATHYL